MQYAASSTSYLTKERKATKNSSKKTKKTVFIDHCNLFISHSKMI